MQWIGSQTDPVVTGSPEFKAVVDTHNTVHKWATESWKAKDAGDTKMAMEYFNKTYDAFFKYQAAIRKLGDFYRTLGYTDKTEIVVFRK